MNWQIFGGSQSAWDAALSELDDGNFYQCYAWGECRRTAGWAPLRITAPSPTGGTEAMAQLLVKRRAGISVIWIPGGAAGNDLQWTASLPRFLRQHFGRTVYCRINDLHAAGAGAAEALCRSGWSRPVACLGTGLSLELDLTPTPDERLANASGNWRHNLRRAGKYGLTIERWTKPNPQEMATVYRDMEHYKGLTEQHSHASLASMIDSLPQRAVTFRCLDRDGRLLAFRTAGVFGRRGWDLLAAATKQARKVYASHAVLWALLDECIRHGVVAYDLGGVDPESNKGVYDFKRGTGARMLEYTGEWEWSGLPLLSSVVGWSLRLRGMPA